MAAVAAKAHTQAGTIQAPALPWHIGPRGEHHPLSPSGQWWVGAGQATPEEVAHIHGIVLYSRTTVAFLTEAEARELEYQLHQLLKDR